MTVCPGGQGVAQGGRRAGTQGDAVGAGLMPPPPGRAGTQGDAVGAGLMPPGRPGGAESRGPCSGAPQELTSHQDTAAAPARLSFLRLEVLLREVPEPRGAQTCLGRGSSWRH